MRFAEKLIYFNEHDSGSPKVVYFVRVENDGRYGCRGSKPGSKPEANTDPVTGSYAPKTLIPYSAPLFRALKEWSQARNAKTAKELEPKPRQPDAVSVLPDLDQEQAKAVHEALERKQHAEYLCYMMLEALYRQVPLQQLIELGIERGMCDEEPLLEFFGGAKDDDDNGCCSAEGHTIESLLSYWRHATDDMLRSIANR